VLAVLLNFLTIVIHSNRIYKTHKIAIKPNPKTSFTSKLLLLTQLLSHLTVWTILRYWLNEFVYICMAIAVATCYLIIRCFIIKDFEADKKVRNNIDDAKLLKPENVETIYWTAVMTSWISPCTVWCDSSSSTLYSEPISAKKRKFFILFVASVTSFFLLVYLLTFGAVFVVKDQLENLTAKIGRNSASNKINWFPNSFDFVGFQNCFELTRAEEPMRDVLNDLLKVGFTALLVGFGSSVFLMIKGYQKENKILKKHIFKSYNFLIRAIYCNYCRPLL